jgi:hypothetical protein
VSKFQYYSDDDQNNQNFDALFKKGEIYYALKQNELAIHDLELYCKPNPSKEVYQLLSKIYEATGDLEKSRFYKELI